MDFNIIFQHRFGQPPHRFFFWRWYFSPDRHGSEHCLSLDSYIPGRPWFPIVKDLLAITTPYLWYWYMRTITWHPWHPWHPTKQERKKTSTQKCLSNGICQFAGGYIQGKCICIEKYVCICMYKHLNMHTCVPGCNIIVQPTPSDLNVDRLTGQVEKKQLTLSHISIYLKII